MAGAAMAVAATRARARARAGAGLMLSAAAILLLLLAVRMCPFDAYTAGEECNLDGNGGGYCPPGGRELRATALYGASHPSEGITVFTTSAEEVGGPRSTVRYDVRCDPTRKREAKFFHPRKVHGVLVIGVMSAAGCPLEDSYQVPVWPYPQAVSTGASTVALSTRSAFSIKCASGSFCPAVLERAIERYMGIIFFASPASSTATSVGNGHAAAAAVDGDDVPVLSGVDIRLESSAETPLQYGVNETYTLYVASPRAQITAANEWAALRALETFAQLVEYKRPSSFSVAHCPIAITDYPRFSWRGLLIDTSRHFFTMRKLKQIVDAMVANKFNILHAHWTDDDSFPVESLSQPNLTSGGAYAREAVYLQAALKDLVQYAKDRGVRVVPEFDMPAHATSWTKGIPSLAPDCPHDSIVLDPTGDGVYNVASALFAEMRDVFPDQFFHIGGDEVSPSCWTNSPRVQAYMKAHGIKDNHAMQDLFEQRMQRIVSDLGRTPMLWEEIFNANMTIDKQTVIGVWKNRKVLTSVVKAGYRALNLYGWYLDRQIPVPPFVHYAWVSTWEDMYDLMPGDEGDLTPAEEKLILGGLASSWSESVDDANALERIFPRASAVAERLWSSALLKSTVQARPRLNRLACAMARRGVSGGPAEPGYCDLGLSSSAAAGGDD